VVITSKSIGKPLQFAPVCKKIEGEICDIRKRQLQVKFSETIIARTVRRRWVHLDAYRFAIAVMKRKVKQQKKPSRHGTFITRTKYLTRLSSHT